MAWQRISPEQARDIVTAGNALVLDIRDGQSFAQAHVPDARHVDGSTVSEVLADTTPDTALVIYCYHGNSSQSAAEYFAARGYHRVYSVDGGFERWRTLLGETASG